jgi:hypothetical protein
MITVIEIKEPCASQISWFHIYIRPSLLESMAAILLLKQMSNDNQFVDRRERTEQAADPHYTRYWIDPVQLQRNCNNKKQQKNT